MFRLHAAARRPLPVPFVQQSNHVGSKLSAFSKSSFVRQTLVQSRQRTSSISSHGQRCHLLQANYSSRSSLGVTCVVRWSNSNFRLINSYIFTTPGLLHSKRLLSTTNNITPPSTRSETIRRLIRALKYARIPFLVISVFGLGYSQGIIDYARDPAAKEAALLETILAGVHAHPSDRIIHKTDLRLARVQRVGHRIVSTAQSYVQTQWEASMRECAAHLLPTSTHPNQPLDQTLLQNALAKDPTVQQWTAAHKHMNDQETLPWQFILIRSEIPNAFVTEMLPHRLFVTTAMMDLFIDNDDELGLVLGHEVSHLILGHIRKFNEMETLLRALEILLLSMDPTDGWISLLIMTFLGTTRTAIGAAFSQEHEREADELGIQIAAMACYDTKVGSRVFEKMHLLDEEMAAADGNGGGRGGVLGGFFDSHPPTLSRHAYLVERSEVENWGKYGERCQRIKHRLYSLLGRR